MRSVSTQGARKRLAAQKATARLSTRRAIPGQDIDCISAEIFKVAKLEKVSDTAYGKMI